MTDTLQSRLRSGAVTTADLEVAADRIDALEADVKRAYGPSWLNLTPECLEWGVGLSFYRDL
jgi:hypothetical protein